MSTASDPNGPLRIAYLTYRGKPHVGGQGVYTRHLTKALADLGHEIEVFGGQPYPILDSRVPLHKLPSLDIFNEQYPGRLPAYWEMKSKEDVLETLQYLTGTFSEPAPAKRRPPPADSARRTVLDPEPEVEGSWQELRAMATRAAKVRLREWRTGW